MFRPIIYPAFSSRDKAFLAVFCEFFVCLLDLFEIVEIFLSVDIVRVAILGEMGSGRAEEGNCVPPESVDYSH